METSIFFFSRLVWGLLVWTTMYICVSANHVLNTLHKMNGNKLVLPVVLEDLEVEHLEPLSFSACYPGGTQITSLFSPFTPKIKMQILRTIHIGNV